MEEKFLALMADLDDDTQELMSGWYGSLTASGFKGVQTPDLPYHITMAILPPDREDEAVALMKKTAEDFSKFPVHISHIGMFAEGRVLFAAPERDDVLNRFHEATDFNIPQPHPWTPHVTILTDEPETVQQAIPLVVRSFKPVTGMVTRLHLCAFQPKREIFAAELR